MHTTTHPTRTEDRHGPHAVHAELGVEREVSQSQVRAEAPTRDHGDGEHAVAAASMEAGDRRRHGALAYAALARDDVDLHDRRI